MITKMDEISALVLIDLQKGITRSERAHPVNEIISNSAALAQAFRNAGLPVVIINVHPGGAWIKARVEQPTIPQNLITQTLAKVTLPFTGFTDIVEELGAQPGDIYITKSHWNAFFNTPLHEQLQQRNVTGIVLGGIATSVGVEGTARAASELGYNVSFAIDAMTDKLMEAHQHSITNIFPRIGETGSVEEIVAKIKNLRKS